MRYFDAHAHIQLPQYDLDRAEVLERMEKADVGALIVGVDSASSRKAVELVQGKDSLWAAVGLHPNDTDEPFDPAFYENLLSDPKVVAIGECGLDYYRPEEPEEAKQKQKEIFEQQIQLAVKYGKPLMIHSRPSKGNQDAYYDTLDMLQSYKQEYGDKLRGDMHFFVGGIEEARRFAEIGFTMSYTAVVTFSRDYDDVIRFLPLENILSETDSPYVAPAPNRGKRNEPMAVREVVRAISEIRSQPEEEVRMALLQNAVGLFRISPDFA
jgi:TatD DNase family protein